MKALQNFIGYLGSILYSAWGILTLCAFFGIFVFGFYAMRLGFIYSTASNPARIERIEEYGTLHELVGLAVVMNGFFIFVVISYLIWKELGLDE